MSDTTETGNTEEFEIEYVHASPRIIHSKDDSIRITDKDGNEIELNDNERACNIIIKIKYSKILTNNDSDNPDYMFTVSLLSHNPSVSIIDITDGKKKVNQISYKIYPLTLGEKIYKFPLLLYKDKIDEYADFDEFIVNFQKITLNEISYIESESFLISTK